MLISILLWLLGALLLLAVLAVLFLVLATRWIAAKAERLVPATGQFVEVDGNRIHYVETGEGRPIIFLHGLGGQFHHFRHTLFASFGPGYRLIALDRPGSGYSVRAKAATGRLPEQAEIVRRFIEVLGLEKPFVVGHSLGGAVALALAVQHPEAISGIALLAPLTHMEAAIPKEFSAIYIRSPALRWIIAHTVAVPSGLKYAERTLAFVFAPNMTPAGYMVEGGGWSGLRPRHFFATSTDIVAIERDLARIEQRYGEIAMPAGILFGASDRVLAIDVHGRPMADKIGGLDFERVEGLGHMPQFIDPQRVTAFIRRIADRAFAAKG